jgi:hypothetical protein
MRKRPDEFEWLVFDTCPSVSGAHFHIQWSGHEWWKECFDSREKATTRALELSGPNEKFTVIEVAMPCLLRGRAQRPLGQ